MMSIFILKNFKNFFKKCLTFYSWSFFAVSYDKAEEAKIPNKKVLSDNQYDQAFDATASAADNDDLPF